MRRRSLTTRLTLSHVLVTFAALALLTATLLTLVQRSQRAQLEANLQAQAQVYASYAAQLAIDTNALGGIAPNLAGRFAIPADVTLRVIAPNGAVLYASRDLGLFPSRAARPLLPNPLPIQPVAREQDRRFVAEPVVRDEQTIGVIELSQPLERERALLNQLLIALIPSTLVALTGAALVGHLLARSLVRPLHRLRRVAAAIAGGDSTARSDDHSTDELGQVAMQLNTMADELQARILEVERLAEARQQFYRSVSHELRTPLTAIRGTAENLEDDASSEQQTALAIIQSEAARLQRLVEELLQPRDTDPAPLRRRVPVDLTTLLAEIQQIMQPRAERAGVALHHQAPTRLIVLGDRDRLKQALLNLVDNAITWTPTGGSIFLNAQAREGTVHVVVRDTGPGIAPELRERVWERGFSTTGSQGIGLALVHDVLAAHGGRVAILDNAGTAIELQLPLVTASVQQAPQ